MKEITHAINGVDVAFKGYIIGILSAFVNHAINNVIGTILVTLQQYNLYLQDYLSPIHMVLTMSIPLIIILKISEKIEAIEELVDKSLFYIISFTITASFLGDVESVIIGLIALSLLAVCFEKIGKPMW